MEYPNMIRVRQKFGGPVIEDIEGEIAAQVRRVGAAARIRPGDSVAIGVGSRGINNLRRIVAALVRELRELGAEPFIVPAMGSHGGATAEGQIDVLRHYGVTEEGVGAPIRSSMEVIEVGRSPEGIAAFVDRNAAGANHIVAVNRIKSHTEFEGRIESGLIKMLCIGLGKHRGAQHYHQAGVNFGFEHALLTGSRIVREKCPVLFGLAIVENGYDQTAVLRALRPEEFEPGEEELLILAKEWMPKLPFKRADLLIVDQIGKNISGTGMDTKVIGRIMSPYSPEPQWPKLTRIVVLDLTDETEGNAVGLGLADFTTRRVVDKFSRAYTYVNCNTAQTPAKGRIPIHYETDRQALDEALQTIGLVEPARARVIRILNTLHLEEVDISESFLPEIEGRPDLEIIGRPEPLSFDEQGNLRPFGHLSGGGH